MNKTDTKPKAELQRYWNPQGGGVEPHDAGLLYLRDEVDAMIAALRAENARLAAREPTCAVVKPQQAVAQRKGTVGLVLRAMG